NHQILGELKKKEAEQGLYEIRINGISLWRLVRFRYRVNYLNKKTGFTNKTEDKQKISMAFIKSCFFSFFQYIKLLFSSKQVDNFVFAFPRLYKIGDNYLDKITDPVISASNLNKNTLIFHHSFGKPFNKQRLHYNKTVNADFIDVFSIVFAKVYKFYVRKKYKTQINELSNRIISVYGSDSL